MTRRGQQPHPPRGNDARGKQAFAPAQPDLQSPAAPMPMDMAISAVRRATALQSNVDRSAADLLRVQTDVLDARTPSELAYFVVNSTQSVVGAQQIALLERDGKGRQSIRAISNITHVDRHSPVTLWLESMVFALEKQGLAGQVQIFEATSFDGGYQAYGRGYPLKHLAWVPWLDRDGKVLGGMIMARLTPWSETQLAVARHLAMPFARAWEGVARKRRRVGLINWRAKFTRTAVAALLMALMAVPVPLTALAPVEIAARNPAIATAGMNGVVKEVLVEPNQQVTRGQLLVRLDDTVSRNRFRIAERDVAVALMRYKKATQLAFIDEKGSHELGIARAELGLKTAERDYAYELLSRSVIKADRDGVVVFGDKRDLVGRQVSVGEKLMEVAAPSENEFHIDLGVADAIVLRDETLVRVFLDTDPLNPVRARLVRADKRASVRENQTLAFRLVAEAEDPAVSSRLLLGARGTAQVYSDNVPLGFFLFRRPISAMRQWIGL